MRKRLSARLHLPSPAMVVAVIALVSGTTGYAVAQLPNPLPLQNQVDVFTSTLTFTVAPGSAQGDTVGCGGRQVTGGGFTSTSSFVHAIADGPQGDNAWNTAVRNTGTTPATVTIYARCI